MWTQWIGKAQARPHWCHKGADPDTDPYTVHMQGFTKTSRHLLTNIQPPPPFLNHGQTRHKDEIPDGSHEANGR